MAIHGEKKRNERLKLLGLDPPQSRMRRKKRPGSEVHMGLGLPNTEDPFAESVKQIAKEKLQELPEDERKLALQILEDSVSGGDMMDSLYYMDYKRRPVDIEQFLDDPFYMGSILYESKKEPALWAPWRHELLDLFDPASKYQEWILGGAIGIGKCQIEGTLVPTSAGLIPIEDVYRIHKRRQRIDVLSESGYRPVTAVHDEGVTGTVKIQTSMGYRNEGRPNHRLRVLQDSKIVWKELTDIVVGDVMLLARKYPMRAGRKTTAAFLRGLFDNDGTVYEKGNSFVVEFTTVSEKLSYEVQCALLEFGIATSRSFKETDHKRAWTVRLIGWTGKSVFAKEIGFSNPKKKTRLAQHLGAKPKTQGETKYPPETFKSIYKECYFFDTVVSKDVGTGHCYDITVHGDPSYVSGGFISHNSTVVAIALTYLLYKLSCLRDPFKYYGLMATALMVFGMYSVTKDQASDVVYGKTRWYLEHIPYFSRKFPIVERTLKYTTFERNRRLRVITGSREFHALGLDMFAFVLDEGNFFQKQSARAKTSVAEAQEQISEAYKIYHQAFTRIESRFLRVGGGYSGMVFMISSKASDLAFLEEHIQNQKEKIKAGTVKLSEFAIWDVRPKRYYTLPRFEVEVGDETYSSRILKENDIPRDPTKVIQVPGEYIDDFTLNVEQALRDHAGVSTIDVTALVKDREAIEQCVTDKIEHPFTRQSIVLDYRGRAGIQDYFNPDVMFEIRNSMRVPIIHPDSARFAHVDLALTGDAASIVAGHVAQMSRVKRMRDDGSFYFEDQPEIWLDLMLQIVPPAGAGEISIQKIRNFLIYLRATGLPIKFVSADGFQSADMCQILQTIPEPFVTRKFSVDKTDEPYVCLRNAIYEDRIRYYHYPPFMKEVRYLVHDLGARKVDHPINFPDGSKGSKDVADGAAAVTSQCVETPNEKVIGTKQRPVVIVEGGVDDHEIRYDMDPALIEAMERELQRRRRREEQR